MNLLNLDYARANTGNRLFGLFGSSHYSNYPINWMRFSLDPLQERINAASLNEGPGDWIVRKGYLN